MRLSALQLRVTPLALSLCGGGNGLVEIVTVWNVLMPKGPGLLCGTMKALIVHSPETRSSKDMPRPREIRVEHLPRRCREPWPQPLETSSKEAVQSKMHSMC